MKSRPFALLLWGLAAGFALVGMTALAAGWRVNTTPSVAVGLWQVEAAPDGIRQGQVVSLCPPDQAVFRLARERHYIPAGRCPGGYEPLLKPVAALPGDWVDVSATEIRINGRPMPASLTQTRDAAGRLLPKMASGRYHVQPGTVWLISAGHADGFDSRYFGPVPLRCIEGVARPLWIGSQP